MMSAHGLGATPSGCPGCNGHIVNLTLANVALRQGSGVWGCDWVDGFAAHNVSPWSPRSTCKPAETVKVGKDSAVPRIN